MKRGDEVVMTKFAAVFLDRDGTINEEVGYLDSLEKLRVLPEAFEAVRLINQAGMKTAVITNQSGIGRGFFDEAFVVRVHEEMHRLFLKEGALIDGFYYCPHHPTEGIGLYRQTCSCRKPEPGLLLKAAEDLVIDLGKSYMIGDTPKDVKAGQMAGAKGILVRTGYGKVADMGSTHPDYIAQDILEAVKWLLSDREAS
ncbi:MAG TPA: D,D-heptose 1,7-bisphosphate phosphatase [Syntrophus sp. (in: bacteria)]|jgi:D,D-heptose 1,7-bisphosphate phosphatase|nr:D,D-heptose 1,7-bisphosphate phosphatase [Syntrophus sp. (in: bacteria)]